MKTGTTWMGTKDLEPRFEPRYLVALDEIYHGDWYAEKRRRILEFRRSVESFWPDGHPTKLIHVTGTSGKGSVAHCLEQGLRRAGGTGSWTGPHIFDYAERFRIDARQVSHEEIAAIYHDILRPHLDRLIEERGRGLPFPEIGILLSLHLMARRGAEWGIMEVGHGGRYSLLQALPATATVLTNIGTDHLGHLGDEIWQRALEKAGLARDGVPFFTAATGESLDFVTRAADEEGALVHVLEAAEIEAARRAAGRPLASFEASNLALAAKVIRHFYPREELADLLAAMPGRLPGRLDEIVPGVVFDVAHNKEKVEALAEALKLAWPEHGFRFILALTRDRDAVSIFRPLCALARRVVVTSSFHMGQDPESIAAKLAPLCPEIEVVADPRRAYEQERAALAEKEILVLTGSIYMIDQALNDDPFLRKMNGSFGRRYLDRNRNLDRKR